MIKEKETPKSRPQVSQMEKVADQITNALGSTWSVIVHTLIFVGIFALLFLDVSLHTILLVITTVVSFEAIYLAIFIQRSANKQSRRLERAIAEIRRSTVIHSKRPLDVMVEEIDKGVGEIKQKIDGPNFQP